MRNIFSVNFMNSIFATIAIFWNKKIRKTNCRWGMKVKSKKTLLQIHWLHWIHNLFVPAATDFTTKDWLAGINNHFAILNGLHCIPHAHLQKKGLHATHSKRAEYFAGRCSYSVKNDCRFWNFMLVIQIWVHAYCFCHPTISLSLPFRWCFTSFYYHW